MYVIIYLPKPTECIIPGMNPKVNYELWMIMKCQYRFILLGEKKCTILMRDVDNGGGYASEEAEGIWEISVSPS